MTTGLDRSRVDRALERARRSAYPEGQFIGQESFVVADEILDLAVRAGIGPGTAVLDVCCGVAGPGRFLTERLGCTYLGVDSDPAAIDIARDRAAHLACRFEVAEVPPLPAGRFDVVLLLETILAFRDKEALLREIAGVLAPGGRFAFTLEEGRPLTEAERSVMPDADTVWLSPLPDILACLERVGLRVRWCEEHSRSHLATVDALLGAFAAEGPAIAADLGPSALADLVAAHRLWSEWLRAGRVRKFAIVAEQAGSSGRENGWR